MDTKPPKWTKQEFIWAVVIAAAFMLFFWSMGPPRLGMFPMTNAEEEEMRQRMEKALPGSTTR